MFGEKEIVGKTIIRVNKNRIIIPKFTGVEIGEELQPMYDIKKQKLLLLKVEEYNEKIANFEKRLQELRDSGEIDYQKVLNHRRYVYGILSFYAEKVDSQRRIHLEERIFRDLNFGNTVFAVGVEKHLEIYPSEEKYHLLKSSK